MPLRGSRQVLGAVAASALASCAILPERVPAASATPPERYASAQSLDAAGADWPRANWWERYDDPQLSALITEALANSPTLAQAQARVRAAGAELEGAR